MTPEGIRHKWLAISCYIPTCLGIPLSSDELGTIHFITMRTIFYYKVFKLWWLFSFYNYDEILYIVTICWRWFLPSALGFVWTCGTTACIDHQDRSGSSDTALSRRKAWQVVLVRDPMAISGFHIIRWGYFALRTTDLVLSTQDGVPPVMFVGL